MALPPEASGGKFIVENFKNFFRKVTGLLCCKPFLYSEGIPNAVYLEN